MTFTYNRINNTTTTPPEPPASLLVHVLLMKAALNRIFVTRAIQSIEGTTQDIDAVFFGSTRLE